MKNETIMIENPLYEHNSTLRKRGRREREKKKERKREREREIKDID